MAEIFHVYIRRPERVSHFIRESANLPLTVEYVVNEVDVGISLGCLQIIFAGDVEFARQISSNGVGLRQANAIYLEHRQLQEGQRWFDSRKLGEFIPNIFVFFAGVSEDDARQLGPSLQIEIHQLVLWHSLPTANIRSAYQFKVIKIILEWDFLSRYEE